MENSCLAHMSLWPFTIGGIIIFGVSVAAGVIVCIRWLKHRAGHDYRARSIVQGVVGAETRRRACRDTELLSTLHEWMIVRRIPRQGDSLFAAVAHQLYRSEVGSKEHHDHTTLLRESTVYQLRSRFTMYWDDLLKAVRDNPARYKQYGTEKERVSRYLDDLAVPGFHAGEECLRALADDLQMEMWLYHVGGSKDIFTPHITHTLSVMRLSSRIAKGTDGRQHTYYDSVLATSPLKQRPSHSGAVAT